MASAEHVSKQADPPSDAPECLKDSVAGYNILVDKFNEQAGMIRTQSEMIDKQKLYITILANEVEVLKAQLGQHEETEQGKPSSRQSTSSEFAGFPDEMSQHESDEPLPQKETSPSVDPDLFGGGPSSPIDPQRPRRSSLMSEEMARDPQSYHASDLASRNQFVTMAQEKASPDMMKRSGGPPFSNKRPRRNVQNLSEDVAMPADAFTPLPSSPPKQRLSVLPSTPRLPSRRKIIQPAFEK
ncbi:hypothetical protein KC354_g6063 [Hortaea werneckii]|nr:hypothetical protein KC354_g6063 [Hortaea werneckii]